MKGWGRGGRERLEILFNKKKLLKLVMLIWFDFVD